jgi:hypothetical protein
MMEENVMPAKEKTPEATTGETEQTEYTNDYM